MKGGFFPVTIKVILVMITNTIHFILKSPITFPHVLITSARDDWHPSEQEDNDRSVLNWFSEHFTLSGALEIEAWWSEDFDSVSDMSSMVMPM